MGIKPEFGSGVILAKVEAFQRNLDKAVLFMGIDEAKFRKPFLPGDVMEMHVVKEKECRGVYRFKCKATCNGVLHAEAILTALMSR